MVRPRAYYNEIDPAAAHILRQLIDYDVIMPGDVDTRSIKDVQPDDLDGYAQCHFFAGGGLWSVAARLAGWPDERPLWTGSCPCQPFSAAGKGLGTDDPRHLWPDFHRLIRSRRPPTIMGEQVAGKAGYGWFDGVRADLEGEGYAGRAVDFPACSVDAPHQRNRLYWIAAKVQSNAQRKRSGTGLREADSQQHRIVIADSHVGLQPDADFFELQRQSSAGQQPVSEPASRALRNDSRWADGEWIVSPLDGKARRAEPGICFLVDGLPGRVDLWRVGGNAIVPEAAAEVIAAFMETTPHRSGT